MYNRDAFIVLRKGDLDTSPAQKHNQAPNTLSFQILIHLRELGNSPRKILPLHHTPEHTELFHRKPFQVCRGPLHDPV